MRVSARDKFAVLGGNVCVRSEGWTGRWSEAEGSRLLPCSRAKPETLAVMRSRDNCATAALPYGLLTHSQSHYNSQNKHDFYVILMQTVCLKASLWPIKEWGCVLPRLQNAFKTVPCSSEPIIKRTKEKTETALSYLKFGLKHLCQVNHFSLVLFALDVYSLKVFACQAITKATLVAREHLCAPSGFFLPIAPLVG